MVNGQTMGSLRAAAVAPPAFAFDSVQAYYLQAPIKHHPSAQGPGKEGASEGSWECQGQCSQAQACLCAAPYASFSLPSFPPWNLKWNQRGFVCVAPEGRAGPNVGNSLP